MAHRMTFVIKAVANGREVLFGSLTTRVVQPGKLALAKLINRLHANAGRSAATLGKPLRVSGTGPYRVLGPFRVLGVVVPRHVVPPFQ